MKKIIRKLEISFALLCVGAILVALLIITENVAGSTNSGYPYNEDVYLPLIQNNPENTATATPTSTPTPTATPTPIATPTTNPYP